MAEQNKKLITEISQESAESAIEFANYVDADELPFPGLFGDKKWRKEVELPAGDRGSVRAFRKILNNIGYNIDLEEGMVDRTYDYMIPQGPKAGEVIEKEERKNIGKVLRGLKSRFTEIYESLQEKDIENYIDAWSGIIEYYGVLVNPIKIVNLVNDEKYREKEGGDKFDFETIDMADQDEIQHVLYNFGKSFYGTDANSEKTTRAVIAISQPFVRKGEHTIDNEVFEYVLSYLVALDTLKNIKNSIPPDSDKVFIPKEYERLKTNLLIEFDEKNVFENRSTTYAKNRGLEYGSIELFEEVVQDTKEEMIKVLKENIIKEPIGTYDDVSEEAQDVTNIFKSLKNLFDEMYDFWEEQSKVIVGKEDEDSKEGNKYKRAVDARHTIILTRHPLDIMRMSDFEELYNCHSETGNFFTCALAECKANGAAGYLVDKEEYENFLEEGGDLQQHEFFADSSRGVHGIEPIARDRIRRLVSSDGKHTLALTEKKPYGEPSVLFKKKFAQYVKENSNNDYKDEYPLKDYLPLKESQIEELNEKHGMDLKGSWEVFGGFYTDSGKFGIFYKNFPEYSKRISEIDTFTSNEFDLTGLEGFPTNVEAGTDMVGFVDNVGAERVSEINSTIRSFDNCIMDAYNDPDLYPFSRGVMGTSQQFLSKLDDEEEERFDFMKADKFSFKYNDGKDLEPWMKETMIEKLFPIAVDIQFKINLDDILEEHEYKITTEKDQIKFAHSQYKNIILTLVEDIEYFVPQYFSKGGVVLDGKGGGKYDPFKGGSANVEFIDEDTLRVKVNMLRLNGNLKAISDSTFDFDPTPALVKLQQTLEERKEKILKKIIIAKSGLVKLLGEKSELDKFKKDFEYIEHSDMPADKFEFGFSIPIVQYDVDQQNLVKEYSGIPDFQYNERTTKGFDEDDLKSPFAHALADIFSEASKHGLKKLEEKLEEGQFGGKDNVVKITRFAIFIGLMRRRSMYDVEYEITDNNMCIIHFRARARTNHDSLTSGALLCYMYNYLEYLEDNLSSIQANLKTNMKRNVFKPIYARSVRNREDSKQVTKKGDKDVE